MEPKNKGLRFEKGKNIKIQNLCFKALIQHTNEWKVPFKDGQFKWQ